MSYLRLKYFSLIYKFNNQTLKKIFNAVNIIILKKNYYVYIIKNKPIVNFEKILKNVYIMFNLYIIILH